MNLKRTYTVSLDPNLAQKVEDYKTENGDSYTDIFIKALEVFFEK